MLELGFKHGKSGGGGGGAITSQAKMSNLHKALMVRKIIVYNTSSLQHFLLTCIGQVTAKSVACVFCLKCRAPTSKILFMLLFSTILRFRQGFSEFFRFSCFSKMRGMAKNVTAE